MNAVDTSVAVAAFASWHPAHAPMLDIVNAGVLLPAHAAVETYSVLTRLPAPHRGSPRRVLDFLEQSFEGDWLALAGPSVRQVIADLVGRGVRGGQTYDGLIGLTARFAGATLLTRDLRAKQTYDLLGVDVQFVG